MRSGTLALIGVLLAGFAALLVVGLTRSSTLVYTLGVPPQGPVAELKPGIRACQGPVDLPDEATFERIGFYPGTAGATAARIEVTVRPAGGGAPLGRGSLAGSLSSDSPPALRYAAVGRQHQSRPITVCFTNRGSRALKLWGSSAAASAWTSATVDSQPGDFDIGVTFERNEHSVIALAQAMAKRASLFHPSLASPVTYALLAALLLIGGPVLLVVAVGRVD